MRTSWKNHENEGLHSDRARPDPIIGSDGGVFTLRLEITARYGLALGSHNVKHDMASSIRRFSGTAYDGWKSDPVTTFPGTVGVDQSCNCKTTRLHFERAYSSVATRGSLRMG